MTDDPALYEYAALRATIRERGTTRIWLFWTGIVAWATLTVTVAAIFSLPVASLIPLLTLAATFEAVYAIHVTVERIGRYLQVFVEEPSGAPRLPAWERTAMAFGHPYPGASIDPLFVGIFLVATFLNLIPVLLAEPTRVEIAMIGGVHALFVARVLVARQQAARQRALDLARYTELRQSTIRNDDPIGNQH